MAHIGSRERSSKLCGQNVTPTEQCQSKDLPCSNSEHVHSHQDPKRGKDAGRTTNNKSVCQHTMQITRQLSLTQVTVLSITPFCHNDPFRVHVNR